MRLILLGFLLHWKDQLPVGGVLVYSQMVKKQVLAIQPIEPYVRVKREWSASCIGCISRPCPFLFL